MAGLALGKAGTRVDEARGGGYFVLETQSQIQAADLAGILLVSAFRTISGFVVAIATGMVCGCGQQEPQLYPLQGRVRFHGKPIPKAEIVFHPLPTKTNSCANRPHPRPLSRGRERGAM